jgi:hypothetical protein
MHERRLLRRFVDNLVCRAHLRRCQRASPYCPDGLTEGAVFLDSGQGELNHHPAIFQNLGFGLVCSVPTVELRSRALPQVSPHLPVGRAAVALATSTGS